MTVSARHPAADQATRPAAPASAHGHGDRIPILLYHEITAQPILPGYLSVRPEDFALQLSYLRSGGFTSLRNADLARLCQTGSALPARPVVLTFDDGFADLHQQALPLLASHGVTGTLFVTTGWIADGRQPRAPGPGRVSTPGSGMLSWSQIEEIAAAGIEIGAHTLTHPQLDQLGPAMLRTELQDSKHQLEDRLGMAVTGLSYPFGYSSPRVLAAAAAAGYSYACVVTNRLASESDDQLSLPRVTIGRATSLPGFARILRARRLPPEFLAYRTLTRGWSVVRQIRSALNRANGD
jgi:peptidoglycan/xylan/chitin deacetylase (PgdA/CDA1 family)